MLPDLLSAKLLRHAGGLALCAASALAAAQPGSGGGSTSVYTCVDAQGRLQTSDRPIMECIDREQRELGRSGALRRVIPPSPTPAERDAQAERERQAAAERQRAQEAARRDQALVERYPDQAAYDIGRKNTLAQTQAVIDAAQQRIAELAQERKKLDKDMEFFRQDPTKAPAKLRRQIESNDQSMQEQRDIIASQQSERDRINARFDQQAKRLQQLWDAKAAAAHEGKPAAPSARN